jgi:uncharacterized protein (UPF0548 family)
VLDRLLLGQPRNPRRALAELHRRELNFDVSRRTEYTSENGWHVDDVRQALPPEPPGVPTPGGSWETARAIARTYDFADPSIVRGVFDREEPLEERTMLLIVHFHRLRIYVGVRVGDVYDEERKLDGRPGRVFGWNYRTLEGHVEQGEMKWEVWKFPETGDVLFRLASFSRAAPHSNLLVRIGFRLFGRREQLRFLALTANRMARLTEEQVARGDTLPTPSGPAPTQPDVPSDG